MNRFRAVRGALLVVAALGTGCQDSRVVSPTAASLFVPTIAGVWSGPMTLVATSGGECAGAVVPTFLPSNDVGTVTITDGDDALTATMTMESTGLACKYSGSRTAGALTMNATSCDRTGLLVSCIGGQTRELRLVGSNVSATWDGQHITGHTTSTYNVFTPPSGQQNGVGSLVASHSFSVTRQ